MAKWELETGGTLGTGGEYTPVQYPRSDANRGQVSNSNKGAASRNDIPLESVAQNTDGNTNVPRRDASVVYDAGPYPKFVDDGTDGMDEGDGASR